MLSMSKKRISDMQMVGNTSLMELPKTSFLSSRRIAPDAVLKCYDWAIKMRDQGLCVISGFQSPLEKDVLKFLLRGRQPIVLVLARKMYSVVPDEFRVAVAEGRMLIVSPVSANRANSSTVRARNRFILERSDIHVFGSIDSEGSLAPLVAKLPGETVKILGGRQTASRSRRRAARPLQSMTTPDDDEVLE